MLVGRQPGLGFARLVIGFRQRIEALYGYMVDFILLLANPGFKDRGIAHREASQKLALVQIERGLQGRQVDGRSSCLVHWADCGRLGRKRCLQHFDIEPIGRLTVEANGLWGDSQVGIEMAPQIGQQIAQVVARLLVIEFTPK